MVLTDVVVAIGELFSVDSNYTLNVENRQLAVIVMANSASDCNE